jgi:hypothetical protein
MLCHILHSFIKSSSCDGQSAPPPLIVVSTLAFFSAFAFLSAFAFTNYAFTLTFRFFTSASATDNCGTAQHSSHNTEPNPSVTPLNTFHDVSPLIIRKSDFSITIVLAQIWTFNARQSTLGSTKRFSSRGT